MKQNPSKTTPKGTETRERILEAALELFRTQGYDATTMRAVAEQAGVSLGNAYYYFKAKEHLLQAFYGEMFEDLEDAAEPVLARERDLRARLAGVLEAKLRIIEPYHRFSALLFRTAADPQSPLNPFNEHTAEARAKETALFARVVEGSKQKVPPDLAAELPGLLWTYSMGMVLFWIYDDSPDRARTRRFIEHSTDIVARCIRLAANPLLRPLRRSVLKLYADLAQR